MTTDRAKTREDLKDEAAELLDTLTDLGASWARYGLTVGRMALETGSESLRVTASILGDLADDMDELGDREPPRGRLPVRKSDAA